MADQHQTSSNSDASPPAVETSTTGSESDVKRMSKAENLRLLTRSNNCLIVAWDAADGDVDTWTIQTATSGFLASWQNVASTSTNEYTLENLTPYTTYLVRICPVHNGVDGEFCAQLRATTLTDAEWQQKRAAAADEFEVELSEIKEKNSALSAELAARMLELETAQSKADLLCVAAKEQETKAAAMQEELVTTKVALAAKSTQLSDLGTALAETRAELASAQANSAQTEELEALIVKEAAAREDACKLSTEVAALQEQSKAALEQQAVLEAKLLESTEKQAAKAKEHMDAEQAAAAQLQATIARHEQDLAETASALKAKDAEVATLKQQREQQQAEILRLKDELTAAASTTALQALRTEREGLRQTTTGLEAQVRGLRAQEAELKQELQPLRARLADMASKRVETAQALDAAKEQVAAERAERQVREVELSEAQAERQRLSDLTSGLNGEIVHTQQRLETLQLELDQTRVKLAAAYTQTELSGKRVLFVDDETINRRLGSKMLMRMGCDCVTLEDGDQVQSTMEQAQAQGRPFDVVIMDIFMERTDGAEVCHKLWRAGIRAHMVAMSEATGPEDVDRYLRAGFNFVLAKPFGIKAMRRALMRAKKGF